MREREKRERDREEREKEEREGGRVRLTLGS